MCIRNDSEKVAEIRQQMTVLQLWKVVRQDGIIGIWGETKCGNPARRHFKLGYNYAKQYGSCCANGRFHCFITRKNARRYRSLHKNRAETYWGNDLMGVTKIIKVCANSSEVMDAGRDVETGIPAISVSKMEIKSLKHQR